MLLYVGGINNINQELYEAASVDGAKKIQAFINITLPLLMPTTFIVLLLSTRISFKGIRTGTGYFPWRTGFLNYLYGTVYF